VWERLTGDPRIDQITTEVIRDFQTGALRAGFACETIETVINALFAVLAAAGLAGLPSRPKRLSAPPSKSARLTLAEFSAFLAAIPAGIAGTRGRDDAWWLAWWGLLYFSAFRLGDALGLERRQVGGAGIEARQTKTGGLVRVPLHPVCRRLIVDAGLPREGRMFHIARKTLYRVTEAVCEASGVSGVTPQAVRVLAARQYERAHPGAGRLILGRGFHGADRYYFDAGEILTSASDKLDVPDALMTDAERKARACAETSLLSAFRRLKAAERETVLKVATSLRRGA
jgi:integrase